jgi:hypothetical protein
MDECGFDSRQELMSLPIDDFPLSIGIELKKYFARVAKRLRRRIANPVFVSSSPTARSNLQANQIQER